MRYKIYLKSRHWKRRRKRSLWLAGYQCEYWQNDIRCTNKKKLQVHHRSYERLWHETDKDLIVLCEYHHQLMHIEKIK
jgi:hypothetical protein